MVVIAALGVAGIAYWRSQPAQPAGDVAGGDRARSVAAREPSVGTSAVADAVFGPSTTDPPPSTAGPRPSSTTDPRPSSTTGPRPSSTAGSRPSSTTDPRPSTPTARSAEPALVEPLIVADESVSPGRPGGVGTKFDGFERRDSGGIGDGTRAEPVEPTLGESFTWHDGDRVLQVWLDPNLVVQPGSDGVSRDDIVATVGDDIVVRGTVSVPAKGDPVFWSDTGELMALPGGVALVLDPDWDSARVDAFLADNAISVADVAELDFVANGFFVETDPGFDSLTLANSLAVQNGVVLSSPNWWTEHVTK